MLVGVPDEEVGICMEGIPRWNDCASIDVMLAGGTERRRVAQE